MELHDPLWRPLTGAAERGRKEKNAKEKKKHRFTTPNEVQDDGKSGDTSSEKSTAPNEVREDDKRKNPKSGRKQFIDIWKEGRVVKLKENFGFISPSSNSESLIPKGKDIFFPKNKISRFCPDLVVGDKVQFTLRQQSVEKPAAHKLRVKTFNKRDPQVVDEYISNIVCRLKDGNINPRDCVREPSVFEFLASCTMETESICNFLELQCILLKERDGINSLLLECMDRIFITSQFCKRGSSLYENVKKHKIPIKILKDYLVNIVKLSPTFLQHILPLIQETLRSEDRWISDVLREIPLLFNKDCLNNLSWEQIPLIPLQSEVDGRMMASLVDVKVISLGETYSNSEEYMDTYFRLYRVECFFAICSGILNILTGKHNWKDINVFHGVQLHGFHVSSSDGIQLALRFEPSKNRNLENSSVLQYGNLICLSCNGRFKEKIWATVCSNDKSLLEKNIVIVTLSSEENCITISEIFFLFCHYEGKAVMVESPTYYKSTAPVLQALQGMANKEIPFKEEIVFGKITEKPPPWVPEIDINSFVAENYPNLDSSQAEALTVCLSRRVAIIQGPPGTGKTFLGLKVVHSFLKLAGEDERKMLILTYKNHALDEFLLQILNFPDFDAKKIVRIGGGSKEERLVQLNLNVLLKHSRSENELENKISITKSKIDSLQSEISEKIKNLDEKSYLTTRKLFDLLPMKKKVFFFDKYFGSNGNSKRGERAMVQKYFQNENDKIKEKVFDLFCKIIKSMTLSEKKPTHFPANYAPCFHFLLSEPSRSNENESVDELDQNETDRMEEAKERLLYMRGISGSSITTFKRFQEENEEVIIKLTDSFESHDHWSDTDNTCNILNLVMMEECKAEAEGLDDLIKQYEQLVKCLKELTIQASAVILSDKKILGMTTTGACMNRDLLALIKPSIVIFEEAAEILEPQLIACLGTWAEHLILIGDHKQLKPHVNTYMLVKDYGFDVSMMERLICQGFPYSVLCMQNRMHPNIASLLKDIYPTLQNNEDVVSSRNAPSCLQTPIFFWSHSGKEAGERSYTNKEEARRVVALALLFLYVGYKKEKITILGAYLGQTLLLKKELTRAQLKYNDLFNNGLPKYPEQKEPLISVKTIDNYQGDENDIVIVSLVRSNPEGKIGFLNSLNRRCVAQSRARCGVYFVGNYTTFSSSNIWKKMLSQLAGAGNVSHELILYCPLHANSKMYVTSAQVLENVITNWFCKGWCKADLECGHQCKQRCHYRKQHGQCKENVFFDVEGCKHKGKIRCFEDKKSFVCTLLVRKDLPCGHSITIECFKQLSEVECKTEINFKFTNCDHSVDILCHQKRTDLYCKRKCNKKYIECNHPCQSLCGVKCDSSECKTCRKIRKKKEEKIQEEEKKAAEKEIQTLLTKMENDGYHLKKLNPGGDDYNSVEDQVIKYTQSEHKWVPIVKGIEEIINVKLKIKWLKAKVCMFKPNSKLKFHGTDDAGIESIATNGFRLPSKAGMYGKGIYFATDSSKSAQEIYTKGSCKLLLCDVLLGETLQVDKGKPTLNYKELRSKGCDSVYAPRNTKSKGGVFFDEYVIFNPDQALPKYIIHWERSDVFRLPSDFSGASQSFKMHRLKKSRQVDGTDPLQLHFRVAESQFLRMQLHFCGIGRRLKILEIEYIENKRLIENFNNTKSHFEGKYGKGNEKSQPIYTFHGTPSQNVSPICKDNFRLDLIKRVAHGHGIYFSELPDVSVGYSNGENKLILCQILTGKYPKFDTPDYKSKGFDSNRVCPDSEGHCNMWVIPEPNQILPCYVLTLE